MLCLSDLHRNIMAQCLRRPGKGAGSSFFNSGGGWSWWDVFRVFGRSGERVEREESVSLWLSVWEVLEIQVVYLTFEQLWHLARGMFEPVRSLNKAFILRKIVIKSLRKIWSKNSQKRRPRGSSIKHGQIWPAKFGQMCLRQIFQVYLLHLSEL